MTMLCGVSCPAEHRYLYMKNYVLPQEHILKLTVNDALHITMICTNAALPEMIIGYLYNEGLISAARDVLSVEVSGDGCGASALIRQLSLEGKAAIKASGMGAPLLITEAESAYRPVKRRYSADYICGCAEELDGAAQMYSRTGGVHCSALFDGGRLLSLFEDIGRHNTLDKIAGDCLIREVDTDDTLLLTTGRVSSDMVRKAGRLGVSAIASYSTTTDTAHALASAAGMSLVTYLKRTPLRVLCGEERIV